MTHCEQVNASRISRESLTDDLAVFLEQFVAGSEGGLRPVSNEEVLEVSFQCKDRWIFDIFVIDPLFFFFFSSYFSSF